MTASLEIPSWQSDDEPTETTPVPEMSDDLTTELEEKLITELASTACERDELRAKLAASERACAIFRNALEKAQNAIQHVAQITDENRLGWALQTIDTAFTSDAGRDYVSLAFHEQEMKDLERERQYVADKLMQKGDHSLPEAVDRWVNDYVPREKLERAQMGCALVRTLATVLRANYPPDHVAHKIAQDIEERLADRGHDYVPKAEVDAAWMNAISQVRARYVLCQNSHENFIVQAIEGGILAARDARKEGDEK